MKANLTKLINDCISLGVEIATNRTTPELAARSAKAIAFHHLPDDCDADLDLIEEHITIIMSHLKH